MTEITKITEIMYKTKKEALQAVSQKGNALEFCLPELQNDKDIVMVAIKANSWAFEYASAEIKNNKYFVMKALIEVLSPWVVLHFSSINIQSDPEVISLAVEKSDDGWEFAYAQGMAALDKELAAKAIVKWGKIKGKNNLYLWYGMHPTIQEFFPQNCWHEKAQAYLYQLEQAKMVSGGSTTENEMVP